MGYKMNKGLIFGAVGLLFGCIADYFQCKQMEEEVRDTVNEELDKRLGEAHVAEHR